MGGPRPAAQGISLGRTPAVLGDGFRAFFSFFNYLAYCHFGTVHDQCCLRASSSCLSVVAFTNPDPNPFEGVRVVRQEAHGEWQYRSGAQGYLERGGSRCQGQSGRGSRIYLFKPCATTQRVFI